VPFKNANQFVTAIRVIFDWHLCMLLAPGMVECISCNENFLWGRQLRAYHRQACTNARGLVWFPVETVKQAVLPTGA